MWFWNKHKKDEQLEAIKNMKEALLNQSEEQSKTSQDLISKLTRLQYKNYQDMQTRLERLETKLQENDASETLRQQAAADQAWKSQRMAEQLLRWLDDMDALRLQLDVEGEAAWQKLIEQWSAQLVSTLAIAEIHELPVLGTSFDPRWSESIATSDGKKNGQASIPYEVLQVVRRGFVTGNGTLLRKAQVITLKEDYEHVKS
ncbi:nucleotide exchange factor GrpE [Paenibacillus alkaliterrae]|uniref:nucleotide exchange factor GrpE n=1 Tax=Paenibacillus alkaliterrae TaxID=320909 RepID=UPI001F3AD5D4|nr:nucleotide exchange factor GrpE [Paenibacillus alkaliterrae]MCF2940703.1 nucleotide exchange factor GrpE [Paenibacillus alkaliterrae]